MVSRILTIILGLACFWHGYNILKNGWSHLYGFPLSKGSGILISLFGLVLISFAFFKRNWKNSEDETYMKCPNCGKSYYQKDAPDGQCHNCSSELEQLDGFYDRHPEYKDKKRVSRTQ